MARTFDAVAPAYASPGSEASIADLGRAIMRGWRWVVFPTLAGCLASFAFVTLVAPRYTGEARIILQASDTYFTRPGNERTEQPQQPQIDEQAVASQVQVVMSRDLAREAIRRLNLVGNVEFDAASSGINLFQRLSILLGFTRDLSDRPPEDRVLEKYYENLLVYPVGKSRIVAVEFRSKDPELASRGANTVAELYLSLQETSRKDQAKSASTWLGSNIDALRKRVAEAEAKVEAFRTRTGLLVGVGTTTLSAQQLSELSTQLAQARSSKSDSEAKAKLIRDAIREGRAFDIPDVANNELIRRLLEQRVNLRTQLALEQRTLLAAHPRIKELSAQVGDLESQLRVAAERTVRQLENDARIAGSRVEAIEASIEAQKKIVSAANENEVQLRALEREARIQREQLESYLGRYREATARDIDYGVPPDARIVSRANVPQIPSFPKKLPIVVLTTLGMLILSIGAIVARELLSAQPAQRVSLLAYGGAPLRSGYRFKDPERPDFEFDLSNVRRAPVLDAQPVAAAEPDPAYDFRQLVERLHRPQIGDRGRRVLVAGDTRGDAARVSHGLALTLSATTRVVIVEADGDESSAVDAVPGLTDLVAGEASFSDVLGREPGSSVHRIVTGTLMNEALTGAPEGLEVTLDALASTYDWVICVLFAETGDELLRLFAGRVDSVVLASSLEPAHPELVRTYEAVRSAGALDVVVAREQATELDEAA